jgi:ankyrin repeat protein
MSLLDPQQEGGATAIEKKKEEESVRGKRNRDIDGEESVAVATPTPNLNNGNKEKAGPSSTSTTTAQVPLLETLKDFKALIRKSDSCEWIGNYTLQPKTNLEVGFLKKEAMALTVLLSYYQHDGGGATSCPVAMVSGQASLGRRLAIFHSDQEHFHRWGWTKSRDKVNLGHNFKLEKAKLGRADYYLGTLKAQLDLGRKEKKKNPQVILSMDLQGRLQMDPRKVNILTGPAAAHVLRKGYEELLAFEAEVFQDNQRDIVDVMMRYLAFDTGAFGAMMPHKAPLMVERLSSVIKNGHVSLAAQIMAAAPDLVSIPAYHPDFLRIAIQSHSIEMLDLVLDCGADINQIHPQDVWLGNYPLHIAVSGSQSSFGSFGWNGMLGNLAMVQRMLERGARTDVVDKQGRCPLHFVLCSSKMDMLRVLLPYYPAEMDLRAKVTEAFDKHPWGQQSAVTCTHFLLKEGLIVGTPEELAAMKEQEEKEAALLAPIVAPIGK